MKIIFNSSMKLSSKHTNSFGIKKKESSSVYIIPSLRAFLIALIVLLYFPVLNNQFVLWDDNINIFGVSLYEQEDALKRIWFSFEMPSYLPVTNTIWYLEKHLFGTGPDSAPYFHAFSVILHTINTLLVFHIARGLRVRILVAFFVAVMFAVHPWRVENVAWATEQKSLISGIFFWGSWILYMSNRKTRKVSSVRYMTTLLFFLLALLSKPTAVAFPLILTLMEYLIFRNPLLDAFKRLFPFFLISACVGIVTITRELLVVKVSTGGYSQAERVLISVRNFSDYLLHTPFPGQLSVFKTWNTSLLAITNCLSAGFFFLAVFLCLYFLNKGRGLFYVWCFTGYLLMLLPVSGILEMPYNHVSFTADRYMYLPLFFILLFLAKGLQDLNNRFFEKKSFSGAWVLAPTVLIALWSYETFQAIPIWKNSVSFWKHNIENSARPHPLALNNLGAGLETAGEFDSAKAFYKKALALNPRYIDALNNLGNILGKLGEPEEAVKKFKRSLKINPENAETHNNLGRTMAQLGRFDEAFSHFFSALQIDPRHAGAHNNLGSIYLQTGTPLKSISHFKKAISINPDFSDAYYNLALAFSSLGKNELANAFYEKALSLNSNKPEYLYSYGNLLLRTGNINEAIKTYKQSISIYSKSAKVHNNLAIALTREGNDSEARKHFAIALRIDPGYEQAKKNLDLLLKKL